MPTSQRNALINHTCLYRARHCRCCSGLVLCWHLRPCGCWHGQWVEDRPVALRGSAHGSAAVNMLGVGGRQGDLHPALGPGQQLGWQSWGYLGHGGCTEATLCPWGRQHKEPCCPATAACLLASAICQASTGGAAILGFSAAEDIESLITNCGPGPGA